MTNFDIGEDRGDEHACCLQLEDYALLMGSVGLFAVLAAIMYLTRKINWYDISERKTMAVESSIV